jgi:hypothetical protein
MAISRRALLIGGIAGGSVTVAAGGLLVNEGVLPGRVRAYSLLGLNGGSSPIPNVTPGSRYDGAFTSRARGGVRTGWSLSVPPGRQPAGLSLLVCLHGAGANHQTAFEALGIDRFLAAAVAAGVPPFVVASVDGDPHGYWHPRASGTDSAAMVHAELVPMLRQRFSLADSLGLYGWSMGGYGALRMVMRGAAVQVAVASSPALFAAFEPGAFAAYESGAFDSLADFRREGLRGEGAKYPSVPTRIDCGNGDPFYFPVRDFVEDMRGRWPHLWVLAPDAARSVGLHRTAAHLGQRSS